MSNPFHVTTNADSIMSKQLAASALLFLLLGNFLALAQWTPLSIPNSTASMRSAYFKSATEGFVAGNEDIRHTTNGGTTWDTVNYGIYWAYLKGCTVEGIQFVSATEGIASGYNIWDNCEIVFKTHDGGNTWTDIRWQGAFGTSLNDMYFPNTTTGFCVGNLGHILKSTNGGDSWNYVNSGTSSRLNGIWFTSATNGIAVGEGIILKTTNGGTGWTSQLFPGVNFSDVSFTSALVGYAISNAGLYKTTNGGTSWSALNPQVEGNDITAMNTDTLFIASAAGVYKSNNAGTQFFLQPSLHPNQSFQTVYFYNSTLGFALNNSGKVFKTVTLGDPVQQNDAGVVAISPLPAGVCQGTHPVQVQIKNYGQSLLTQAKIEWEVNGLAQPPFQWNGNLASDSSTTWITIGSYNFGRGTFTIKAYTTEANAQWDYIPQNDTSITAYDFLRLGGNLTIGGASPDFATFQAAVTALNVYGTCGNVTFKIRNGTYQPATAYNFGLFPKDSPTDTVFFQSEAGDSSQVILKSFMEVLKITGSENIVFSKLTIHNYDNGNVVQLDSVSNIQFQNCAFLLPASGTGIYHTGIPNKNTVVKSCRFFNGAYGINYTTTLPTDTNDGIFITRCVFDSLTRTAISIGNSKNILIQNNMMNGISSANFYGIELFSCNSGFVIDKNKIITKNSRTLLNLNACRNASGTEGLVSNNFFGASQSTLALTPGIHLFNCFRIRFVYNTLNCSSDYAIRIVQNDTASQPQHTFVNNIVCNRRNTVLFQWEMPASANGQFLSGVFKDIGHNDYYNLPGGSGGNPYLFFSLGDFNDWKSMYPSDTTSLFADPQFVSYADYHFTPNDVNISLDNIAKPVTGILTDLDNNARNATTPDPGCSEFTLYSVDAGVKYISQQTFPCSGLNSVDVRIGNFGLSTIVSGTIQWKVNGTLQAPYAWSGNVASHDSSSLFSLGTYNFLANNSYSIEAWMSNANSSADFNHINDTAASMFTARIMSGSYTIGGASPDYATFNLAINDLKLKGICGSVLFNVRPGTYHEFFTIPPIAGASLVNTITFQSENFDSTSVLIYYKGAHVVTIDTAGYLVFNQLTILDSTSTSQACIYLRGKAHHLTVKHCVLNVIGNGLCIYNDGLVNSDLNIEDNRVYGGMRLRFSGGFEYHNNIRFRHNQIFKLTTAGIDIMRGKNILIDNNYIQVSVPYSPGSTRYGIYIWWNTLTDPIKNVITNNRLELRNVSYGIYYSANGPVNDKSIIANNMVAMYGQGTETPFYIRDAENLRFVNNSGLIDSCTNVYPVLFCPNTGSEVLNNSLCNKGSGPALHLLATNTAVLDYNNYYTASTPAIYDFYVRYDLANWQLVSGKDQHSVSGNPDYVSISDLHSTGSSYLSASALSQSYLTKDIDGDPRDPVSPDIGADEFNLVLQANDAGVKSIPAMGTICSGPRPVQVQLKNYGSASLLSATVNWTVNGMLQTPFSWNGNLPSLAATSATIGNYNFASADTFNIVAWTTSPNGSVDGKPGNDTAKLINVFTKMAGTYTLGGANPDFVTLYSFLVVLDHVGICGPVTLNVRNGIYNGSSEIITSISGTSLTDTVVIQSESGDSSQVIFNGMSSDPPFEFSGCDFFTLKHLTINNGIAGDAVNLYDGSEHCNIMNCVVNGNIHVMDTCHHTQIANNLVYDHVVSLAGSTTATCYGNIVRNNTIINNIGIGCYEQDSLLVEKNTIINPDSFATSGHFGISLSGWHSTFRCVKNYIHGNFNSGIIVSQFGRPGAPGIVANNVIVAGNAGGICASLHCWYVLIAFNTFFVPAGVAGYPIWNDSHPFDNIIKNNQFINYGTDWACYWSQVSLSNPTVSDFNNYYTNGTNLINVSDTTNYLTVAAFRAAYPGYENNSTQVDPQFPSSWLAFPSNSAALGTGTPLIEVTDDFNGSIRHPLNPTMGAYETSPPLQVIENSATEYIRIYPNPVSDKLTIEFDLSTLSNVRIEITDILGKKIQESQSIENPGRHQIQISLRRETIAKGIYLLKLIRNGNVQVRKLSVH